MSWIIARTEVFRFFTQPALIVNSYAFRNLVYLYFRIVADTTIIIEYLIVGFIFKLTQVFDNTQATARLSGDAGITAVEYEPMVYISEYLLKLDSADANDKSVKDVGLMQDKLAWLKNRFVEL